MLTRIQGLWGVRVTTLAVWILAAGSAGFWGLRWLSGQVGAASPPATQARPAVDAAAVGRVLGAAPAAAAQSSSLSSRFALQGVVAGVVGGGAALIAVDGKPPRAYPVGSEVDSGLVLQSVAPRHANLAPAGNGPVTMRLDMPPLKIN